MSSKFCCGFRPSAMFAVMLVTAFLAVAPGSSPAFAKGIDSWNAPFAEKYPPEKFVVGLGAMGVTGSVTNEKAAQAARDAARAEIAKYFSVTVDARFSSLAVHVRVSHDDQSATSFHESVSDITQTRTVGILQGVEIVETWGEDNTWFAVAVLDKARARDLFQSAVAEIDTQIRDLVAVRGVEGNSLARVRALNRAMLLHVARKVLQTNLVLVDGPSLAPPVSESDLLKQYSEALREISVAVVAVGDDAPALVDALQQGISAAGFLIADSAARASLVVRVDWRTHPEPPGGGKYVFASWNLGVAVSEAAAAPGVNILTATENGREGQNSIQQAVDRCVLVAVKGIGKSEKTAKPGLAEKIVDALVNYPAAP